MVMDLFVVNNEDPRESDNATIIKFIFTGFGSGSTSLVSPVYSTEISETSIRGILGSFFKFGAVAGTLLVNALGTFMHWYYLTVLISVLPGKYLIYHKWENIEVPYFIVIMAALLFMMPESPVFLLSKGKEKAARESLIWLRGTEYDTSEEIEQVTQTNQT